MPDKKGFTLMEVIAVVIIISILVAIAFPRYDQTVEKSRITEAREMLRIIRDAEVRYALQFDAYGINLTSLDIGFNGTGKYFDFWISSTGFPCPSLSPYDGCESALATAVRNSLQAGIYSTSYNVIINESGAMWSFDGNVNRILGNQ